MLQGKRFVLTGLSRLTLRVAKALAEDRAEVVALRRPGDREDPLRSFPPQVRVVEAGGEDAADALRAAGLTGADCLLALSDDDLENLRDAVAARDAAPEVPVVLRAFDAALADQLEQGLNVRRAFSVSALAAPVFLAAACGDQVLETLRLGDSEVPLCRVVVRPGSPLEGRTAAEIKNRFGCGALALRPLGGDWTPVLGSGGEAPLRAGAEVLLGGPLYSVLRLSVGNAGWLGEGKRRVRRGRTSSAPRPRHLTRLPAVAAALGGLLAVSIAVFASALHLRLIDAFYFVITTATTTGYGDISLKDAPDWLKLFGCLVMLTGGALLGILFSYLAALATAERLEESMGRRAGRMSGHLVVAGLGNLGYRLARILTELGLEAVVIELSPDARFAETVRARTPVLTGDARLPETLEQAGVAQAAAFLACTNDDLVNIQASLHARRLNPSLRTVARVYDETLAERLTAAFEIDEALSATRCAVSSFVGAATDERAFRSVRVGALDLLAFRYAASSALTAEDVSAWRAEGVRVLAFRTPSGSLRPPSDLPLPIPAGCEMILAGPSAAVRRIASDG